MKGCNTGDVWMNGEFDFESGESLKNTSWMDGCQMHGWMDALHCVAMPPRVHVLKYWIHVVIYY